MIDRGVSRMITEARAAGIKAIWYLQHSRQSRWKQCRVPLLVDEHQREGIGSQGGEPGVRSYSTAEDAVGLKSPFADPMTAYECCCSM